MVNGWLPATYPPSTSSEAHGGDRSGGKKDTDEEAKNARDGKTSRNDKNK
jgi:hypothetical protein